MKNLPEKELFNDLENRLRQYTERPDEKSWDTISSTLHPVKAEGAGVWLERTADILVIALLLFLFWNSVDTGTVDVQQHSFTENLSKAVPEKEISIPSSTQSAVREQLTTSSPYDMKSGDEANHTHKEEKGLLTVDPDHERNASSTGVRSVNKAFMTTRTSDQVYTTMQMANTTRNNSSGSKGDSLSSVENVNSIVHTERMEEKDSVAVTVLPETQNIIETNAEKKEKEQKKRKGTTMYFSLTPSLAYQKITPRSNDEMIISSLPSESIFSSNRFGISLEAGFQKRIFKKLEVYAGVSYYMQDQTIAYNVQSQDKVEVETTADQDFMVTPGVQQREFKYSMRNMGASTGIFYLIKGGMLQHKAGIGIQYQKGLGKTSSESGYENSSSQYLHYQLNYRMEFFLNKRTSFYVQPNFTRAFYTAETLDGPFTIKPYRAGVGLGMLFTFR